MPSREQIHRTEELGDIFTQAASKAVLVKEAGIWIPLAGIALVTTASINTSLPFTKLISHSSFTGANRENSLRWESLVQRI